MIDDLDSELTVIDARSVLDADLHNAAPNDSDDATWSTVQ